MAENIIEKQTNIFLAYLNKRYEIINAKIAARENVVISKKIKTINLIFPISQIELTFKKIEYIINNNIIKAEKFES